MSKIKYFLILSKRDRTCRHQLSQWMDDDFHWCPNKTILVQELKHIQCCSCMHSTVYLMCLSRQVQNLQPNQWFKYHSKINQSPSQCHNNHISTMNDEWKFSSNWKLNDSYQYILGFQISVMNWWISIVQINHCWCYLFWKSNFQIIHIRISAVDVIVKRSSRKFLD